MTDYDVSSMMTLTTYRYGLGISSTLTGQSRQSSRVCVSVLLCTLSTCGPQPDLIAVNVLNVPQRAETLSIVSYLTGRRATNTPIITAPLNRFALQLPVDSGGSLLLDITALDVDSCVHGTGQLVTSLPARGHQDVEILITPQIPRKCGSLTPCPSGKLCSPMNNPTVGLNGVWSNNDHDVWAVGDRGAILHFNGVRWDSINNPITANLYAIWGTGATDVWAAGEKGTILHYNGNRWTTPSNGAIATFRAIWGSSANDIWAVGDVPFGGTSAEVWHWDGNSWKQNITEAKSALFGIWGNSAIDVYATGAAGLIVHYNGTGWSLVGRGVTVADLRSVWGIGPTHIFAAGTGGTALQFDGMQWAKLETSGIASALNAIGGSQSLIYIVGDGGIFLQASAPYYRFASRASGSSANVKGLAVSASGIGWIIGADGILGYFDDRP